MGKFVNDAALDAALNYIASNATEMYVCTSQPTDRATAISTKLTAVVAPTFTAIVDGPVSGRKLPVVAKTGVSITASGNGTHIALCSGTTLLAVTTCTLQALVSGGTVTIPLWNAILPDVV
jgi:hypothetical protein